MCIHDVFDGLGRLTAAVQAARLVTLGVGRGWVEGGRNHGRSCEEGNVVEEVHFVECEFEFERMCGKHLEVDVPGSYIYHDLQNWDPHYTGTKPSLTDTRRETLDSGLGDLEQMSRS